MNDNLSILDHIESYKKEIEKISNHITHLKNTNIDKELLLEEIEKEEARVSDINNTIILLNKILKSRIKENFSSLTDEQINNLIKQIVLERQKEIESLKKLIDINNTLEEIEKNKFSNNSISIYTTEEKKLSSLDIEFLICNSNYYEFFEKISLSDLSLNTTNSDTTLVETSQAVVQIFNEYIKNMIQLDQMNMLNEEKKTKMIEDYNNKVEKYVNDKIENDLNKRKQIELLINEMIKPLQELKTINDLNNHIDSILKSFDLNSIGYSDVEELKNSINIDINKESSYNDLVNIHKTQTNSLERLYNFVQLKKVKTNEQYVKEIESKKESIEYLEALKDKTTSEKVESVSKKGVEIDNWYRICKIMEALKTENPNIISIQEDIIKIKKSVDSNDSHVKNLLNINREVNELSIKSNKKEKEINEIKTMLNDFQKENKIIFKIIDDGNDIPVINEKSIDIYENEIRELESSIIIKRTKSPSLFGKKRHENELNNMEIVLDKLTKSYNALKKYFMLLDSIKSMEKEKIVLNNDIISKRKSVMDINMSIDNNKRDLQNLFKINISDDTRADYVNIHTISNILPSTEELEETMDTLPISLMNHNRRIEFLKLYESSIKNMFSNALVEENFKEGLRVK